MVASYPLYQAYSFDLSTLQVWKKIGNICVSTIMSAVPQIRDKIRTDIKSDYNCFKLFGFDVFIDSNLKPWLLEVNNIPSLFPDPIDRS